MDYRKAQGAEIALLGRVTRKRGVWLVPSHNRAGVKYVVKIDGSKPTCTCPDFLTNGKRCKHIHAVIYHTEYPKPQLVDPPKPLPPVKKRKKTYRQNWREYNESQTREKEFFLRLLKGVCDTIPDETEKTVGRPRIPTRDAVFATCFPWDLDTEVHDRPSDGPLIGVYLACAVSGERHEHYGQRTHDEYPPRSHQAHEQAAS